MPALCPPLRLLKFHRPGSMLGRMNTSGLLDSGAQSLSPNARPRAHHAEIIWSRRRFLRAAGIMGAAPWVITAAESTGPRVIGANEKLHHACIGVSGMGWGDLQSFTKHQRLEVIAIC